ncbi:MAG: hypothetical protein PHQ65_12685 [Bacteroidales bacterium]|nr:hypothetical protein [Bacteroidales bacterium]MDD3666115.1 hypothetical protein [Bacteroidales bacterium]
MFSAIHPYSHTDHFFYRLGDSLETHVEKLPDLPGVFIIFTLAHGRINMVYVGATHVENRKKGIKAIGLKSHLNTIGIRRSYEDEWNARIATYDMDALDVYWYVTMDNKGKNDLPGFVKANVLHEFFDVHGCLPAWQESF